MAQAEAAEGRDAPSGPPPRANTRLQGQEAAERTLLEAWQRGRLAHAWLLTGPPGIGKATLAYRFARYVLASSSREPREHPPSQGAGLALPAEHPVARRVAAQGHADLRVAERPYDEARDRLKTEIPVDTIRDLTQFLHHTSAGGGWRVAVVDGAEAMNRNAQNALLKALEEPPPDSLLLLVCARPHALLPTIRSRCRVLALPALAPPLLQELLTTYRPDLTAEQQRLLIGLAGGSLGQALQLARVEGGALCRELLTLLTDLPRLDWPRLHALAERLAQRGQESRYEAACQLLTWWLRRFIRCLGTGERPAPLVESETTTLDRLTALAGAPSQAVLERWLTVWDKVRALFGTADQAHLDHRQTILIAFHWLEQAAASEPVT